MKLIINIPEEEYKEVLKDTYSGTHFENKIFTTVANGTPIPDNEKEEPTSPCDLCRYDYLDGYCGDCPAMANMQKESE